LRQVRHTPAKVPAPQVLHVVGWFMAAHVPSCASPLSHPAATVCCRADR
jgi:hypothetical protein